jgi:hypothetical protein
VSQKAKNWPLFPKKTPKKFQTQIRPLIYCIGHFCAKYLPNGTVYLTNQPNHGPFVLGSAQKKLCGDAKSASKMLRHPPTQERFFETLYA